jgi:molybdopterin converting factor subunit 1
MPPACLQGISFSPGTTLPRIPYNSRMVRVLLFASLREIIGQGEIELASSPEVRTAGDLFDLLCRRQPALEAYRTRVRVAVNETYGSFDSPVADGDEVALFPPVSGGSR